MQFAKYLLITPVVMDLTIFADQILSDPSTAVEIITRVNINTRNRRKIIFNIYVVNKFYNTTLLSMAT
jgi:hypothetical protein